jgi:maltose O-acetyltransferase
MRRILIGLASWTLVPRKARWLILRAAGVTTRAWNIGPGCYFSGRDITIGRGTYINRGCLFDGFAPVHIGERCAIGMRAMFVTSSHGPGTPDRRAGDVTGSPVTVGDGCWIGAQAVVLPGVTVGAGCVIASGAVVTDDCDSNGLYAGVPARLVRSL